MGTTRFNLAGEEFETPWVSGPFLGRLFLVDEEVAVEDAISVDSLGELSLDGALGATSSDVTAVGGLIF